MKSKFLSLEIKDWIRGLFMAVGAAVVDGAIIVLNAGAMPNTDEYKRLAIVGLSAGLVYIAKNLLTNSNDQFLKKEADSKQ